MIRVALISLSVAVLTGCRDLQKEKPLASDVVGLWTATKVDRVVQDYLGAQAQRLADKSPEFEVKEDGSALVRNIPTATGIDQAIIVDSPAKWRIEPFKNSSGEVWWQFWLILDQPKRVLSYDFRKDKSGTYLKESFDVDSGAGIAFRRR